MTNINELRQRLAGKWDYSEGDPNGSDEPTSAELDKEYGPRGTKQELDETLAGLTYDVSDKGLGVRDSPLEHDFSSRIQNTDERGHRIQDTESMQGPIRQKGMITYGNAKKWAKLKQRLARLYEP